MSNDKAVELLKSVDAIFTGHFKLSSGLHSDTYIQCARVFQDAVISHKVCQMLGDKLGGLQADTVVGPALGGIIFAYEMSRVLGLKNIFCERTEGEMKFRRGFGIIEGERVLVVEDVVTTGGSALEAGKLVESLGGKVVGVCSLVDRSAGKVKFPWNFTPLITMDVKTYQPDECPLCKDGVEIYSPGSRHKT
ncbi:MAG TPA: orotate phosphoribosyltransferase [Caldisericia bacterium]|nr:orotate phosphoribosyltransferase [Caldisericia bacterium]HPF48214.1 orotate phosphoribosyltransferase [Caldisericia bacterium]HPI83850.1 orotate phosphoribosyltransferase [Caldisericia bacterium]HPQ92667.1 orotate phosphoribosyltransferase [Caldisericia bacterium]HRV74235.1 orotate phosphoribosyltransferase [Caldisericia bacterium]